MSKIWMSVSFGVRAVSAVVSVTRKRMYARAGEGIFPSAPTAAQSLQLMRSLLVEVSTRGMSVTPGMHSLETDTLPAPESPYSTARV